MAELKVADSTWQLGWPLGVTVRLAYEEIVTVLADNGRVAQTSQHPPTTTIFLAVQNKSYWPSFLSVGFVRES